MGSLAAVRPKRILYVAAALSLVAALIHLWVMPEPFQEWWGYGAFFLVASSAQLLYVPLLLRWPNRAVVLLLGIAGNLAIVVLYVPLDEDGGHRVLRSGGWGSGGCGLHRRVRYHLRAGDRRGTECSAVAGDDSREEAHERARCGRRVGLGRAYGALAAARVLSVRPWPEHRGPPVIFANFGENPFYYDVG